MVSAKYSSMTITEVIVDNDEAPPKIIAHERIVRKKGISATSNLINFVCGMIGPGCFSVAMTFRQAGLWMGLFLVFLMGGLSMLSMYKIIQCSQKLALMLGDEFLDYGDMAKAACEHSYRWLRPYSNVAKWIVNLCLVFFQVGVISVCFVFIADHVMEILQYFITDYNGPNKIEIMLIYFVPQLILNFSSNMRIITVLSLIGNFSIFAAVILIAKELIFHSKYESTALPAITDFNGIVLAAGALIYSFEGQAMVLPLENKLKHPEDMLGGNGVLCTSMNLVVLIYAFLGFFGFLTFGPDTEGSLTLNLPDNGLSTAVKILLILKIFVGNALQLYVIITILWPPIENRLSEETSARKWGPYLLRAVLMLISLAIAVSVPNLNNIIPLVGITSGMMLSLVIPAFLDSVLFWPIYSENNQKCALFWSFLVNCALFIAGWFFMISGLMSSIETLM